MEIDFSTDEAQLNNNGTCQFWPIQFQVVNCTDKRAMITEVFKSYQQKLSNPFNFFEKFVEEIVIIRAKGGIVVHGRRLHVRCFIADASARAMVLNHYIRCRKKFVASFPLDITGIFSHTNIF